MKKTHMQHQREQDDAAELDALVEQIRDEMREELLTGGYYVLEYRDGLRIVKDAYDGDNVVDQMIELDSQGFNQAVMLTARDPIEAARILTVLMERAVEQVIGLAKVHEDAAYRMELAKREVA